MEGVSVMADQFIICHANSERQVQSIAREVTDQATKAGFPVEGWKVLNQGRWILVDIGDVVVHVFHRDERGYYNLEKHWGDAPMLEMAERNESGVFGVCLRL